MEPTPSREPQPPKELSAEELEAFRDRFRPALADILDFFEPEDFVMLRPADMNVEGDERSFEDLHTQEIIMIERIAFEELGIENSRIEESVVRTYFSQGQKADGTRIQKNITVYTTNRKGFFLHKGIYDDGDIVYALGPQDMEM